MSFTATITLTTGGSGTGPFNLYSDVDSYVTPFETGLSKSVLQSGYISTLIPNGSTIVRIMSMGQCVTYDDVTISGLPSPSATPQPTITPTPTPTPSINSCSNPILNMVTPAGGSNFAYTWISGDLCSSINLQYSINNYLWIDNYVSCTSSPQTINVGTTQDIVYFRIIKECVGGGVIFSNVLVYIFPSSSPSPTPTRTITPSPTPTRTITPSPTPTRTITPSISITPSMTITPTITPSKTPTPSLTPFLSSTPTPSVTLTPFFTPTPTPSSLPLSGFNNRVLSISLSSSEDITILGSFTSYSSISSNSIIQLSSDFGINTYFNYGTGLNAIYYQPADIIFDGDGNMIIGNYFTTYKGVTAHSLIKILPNGSRDNSFVSPFKGTPGAVVGTIYIDSNGKILVGGTWDASAVTGQTVNGSGLLRLNNDGTLDNTFTLNTHNVSSISQIKSLSTGKILVTSWQPEYMSSNYNGIFRLNSDGTIDTTFYSPSIDFKGSAFDIQSDDKIIVGGQVDSYDGNNNYNKLVRLNSDGSIDTTFNSTNISYTGTGATIISIKVQSDDKILLGGIFSSYNSVNCNNIIRLNSNGTIDNTFDYGTGFNNGVNDIKITSIGDIIIGGSFTTYKGITANRIIKLDTYGNRLI